jgi:hypothetical protein
MTKSFSLKSIQSIYEEEGKKEAKQYFDEHIFITTSFKFYVLIDGKLKCYTKEQIEFLYINRMPKFLQKYFRRTQNIFRVIRNKSLPQIGNDYINLTPKIVEEPSKLEKFIKKGKNKQKESEVIIEVEDFKTAHLDFMNDFI